MIATPKKIEIKEFAHRVERLCDFLLAQINTEVSGDKDILIIKDLKEDAADLQFDHIDVPANLEGLDNYMKGLDKES